VLGPTRWPKALYKSTFTLLCYFAQTRHFIVHFMHLTHYGERAYCDKLVTSLVGWLVGWSLVGHVRELWLNGTRRPIVTGEH